MYQAAPPAGETHGAYDALGRVPVMKADDGRVVSARVYNGYSGALTGECKKFSTGTTCTGSVNASTDLFRTDATEASYQGGKLKGFKDDLTSTRYTMTYLPSGRLSQLVAHPEASVGALTQDWTESYTFNGVGNLQSVGIIRNSDGTNPRGQYTATATYVPESPASGQVLDRAKTISTSVSAGTSGVTAGSLSLEYDLLGHLTRVSRTAGTNERLYYAPGGELLYRQVDDKFVFYVGEYATVTASSTVSGCATSCGTKPCACTPSAGSVEVDAHVVFAGTRIASAKPTRTLFYYRTRLGSVIATSLGGGAMGAMYRHDPCGKLELATGETSATSSELGYTNALRLSGGLLYLKNRVYDTEARVFIQPDTVDRLTYAYVQGDPVNFADPTGLAAEWMQSATNWAMGMLAHFDALVARAEAAQLEEKTKSSIPEAGAVHAETAAADTQPNTGTQGESRQVNAASKPPEPSPRSTGVPKSVSPTPQAEADAQAKRLEAPKWAHDTFADKGYGDGFQCNDMVSKSHNAVGQALPEGNAAMLADPHMLHVDPSNAQDGDDAFVIRPNGTIQHSMKVDTSMPGFEFWSTTGSPEDPGKLPAFKKSDYYTNSPGSKDGTPNGKTIEIRRWTPIEKVGP